GGIPPALGSGDLVCADTSVILTSDFSCEVVDKIFYRSNKFITLTPLVYTLEDAMFRTSNGYMLSDHRPAYTKFKYTLASNLSFSDQFGGPHGTSYNDANSLPDSPKVSSIGIKTGSRVDQVNLTLSNGTTFTHGGTGGTANSLTLQSGEYVTSVYMCSGSYSGHTRVFYIKFTTNLGRTLGGGSATSTSVTYTAPSGWQIVGFHGRCGDELDKMGVIYAPVK
ncbi:MAG TPA: jacalin-like lectin, partial [Bacteroidales bacterium]